MKKKKKTGHDDSADLSKRAGEALRKSEEKYRLLIENSPDIIYTLTPEGVFLFVSPAWTILLGHPVTQVVGKPFQQFIHPDDLARYQAFLRRTIEPGQRQAGIEYRVQHADGSWRWHATKVVPQKDEAGTVVGYEGIASDITDRKPAEEALRESEEQLRAFMENAPEGVYLNDLAGKFLYGNRMTEEIIGYKREEIIGKNMMGLNLLPPDGLAKAAELLQANFRGQSTGPDELILNKKDGSQIIVEINTSVTQRLGQPVVIGFVKDITNRKRTEKEIRMLSTVVEQSTEGMAMTDLEGNLTFVNEAWCRMHGYKSPKELLGKSLAIFHNQEQIENDVKPFNEKVIEHGACAGEVGHIKRDGKPFPTLMTTTLLKDKQGRPFAIVGIAKDITERKQAEEKLRESEERFHQLSDLLPQIVFETDIKGNLTFANQYGLKSFGYSLEDFQSGINILTLVTPEYRESLISRLKEILGGSETAPREFQVIRKDGGIFPILMHANAILEEGVPIGVRGIAIDITERKRAEEALQQSEEKYRTLVENAAEAILVAQDGMLKFVNRMAIEIIGYSEQELRSSPFLEFIHPDDREMVGERYLRRLGGDVSIPRYAFRLINKDGSIKWVEIDAVLVAWEGKPATLNFLNDITERKEAEDKLQHTLNSLRKAISATFQVLVSAVEARDPYTSGHQIRSADLARSIATEMKLSQDKIEGIRVAATIHDIGKLSIPAEILSKPSKLTEIEFSLIKEHSKKGYEILKDVESPWRLAEIVYQHHERMNGSGYPRNLRGDDILMEARILAVADVVEAMVSHRPYRPGLGIDAAMKEVEKNRGILYDIDVADACLRLFRENGYQLPSGGLISYGRIGV